MAFCKHCGAQLNDTAAYCPACGRTTGSDSEPAFQKAQDAFSTFNDTTDSTGSFTPAEINAGKGMSYLAYIGVLVLIPFFAEKSNRFVQYHARQGLILFILEVVYAVAMVIIRSILWAISWRLLFIATILSLISFGFLALSIIGLVNVSQGQAKELPLLGKIKLFKNKF